MVAIDFDLTFVRIHTTGRWTKNVTDLCAHVRPVFRRLVPSLIKAGIVVAIVSFSPQESLIREVLQKVFPDIKLDHDIFVRGSRHHSSPTRDDELTPTASPKVMPPTTARAPVLAQKENMKPVSFFGGHDARRSMEQRHQVQQQQPAGENSVAHAGPGRMKVCTDAGEVVSGVSDARTSLQKPCSAWSPPSGGKRTHLACVVRFCAKARSEAIFTNDQIVLIDDDVNNVQAARSDGIRAIRFRALESNIAAEENMLTSMANLGVQGFEEEDGMVSEHTDSDLHA
jgi:hypothetical protein